MGFLEFCDGLGISYLVYGPVRGSANDIAIWYESDYSADLNTYFGDKQILFDGIFEYVEGPFLTPIRDPHNIEHELYNALQRDARVIIENKFGKTKRLWPILMLPFARKRDLIGLVYRCCVILTNILITHQSPMRRQ